MRAEALEELLAAGEDHDLHAPCGVREDIEHQPHTPVVGERERIVQDQRGGRALVDEHFSEGEAHENGDLFLSAHAQVIKDLLVSRLARHTGDFQVLVHADFGVGEEHLKVGMYSIDDWGEVALSGFALSGAKCVSEQVEDIELAAQTVALVRRPLEFVLRMFDRFVNAGAVMNLNTFTQADRLDSRIDS